MQLLEVEKGAVELKKGTSDSDIKKYTDKGIDVQLVDPSTEKLEEEAGRKYTAEESQAVGKTVGKSLLKVLRGQGDEVVDIRLTGVGLNKFGIKVKYGNDKGQDLFKFTLDPDAESITLHSGTEPVELVDFIITQGNTVSLPTPDLEDKLADIMKKYVSEPSPEEYDQMAAMEPESDPSQINKYISEATFNITGLGTFEFTGMKDGLVMGSQNNGPVRSFRKEKVLQDNPSFFDRKPRERKPQGVRPYSKEEYREILQGAIDDAGGTEFAYDLADSMILNPQILARLAKDYPGESARELKQQLQYDLEACDSPDDDYDDDYEDIVPEAARPDYRDFDRDGNEKETMKKALRDKELAKGINEDLDLGHEDDEPGMLLSDIYGIMQSAKSLYQLVSQFKGEQEVDFPHWWQAKIVNAKANLSAARQYLDYEVNKPQQVNIVAVALQERKKK